MRAFVCLAALVALWAPSNAFFPYGSFREASSNYYDMITHCDKEGGDCIDVDFPTTDPPPPPTTTRRPPPTPAPRTIIQPIFVTFPPPFFNFFDFWPTTRAPLPPIPTTRAPPKTTRAPPATTLAPTKKTTKAPKGKPKPPRKNKKRPAGGENEREVRKRRQVDVFMSLHRECSGGWEFDAGCQAKKGKNICCYSSNSGYKKK